MSALTSNESPRIRFTAQRPSSSDGDTHSMAMCDGFRGGTRVPIDVRRVRACGEERVGRGGCEDERETAML
jgi:hypothetical protein